MSRRQQARRRREQSYWAAKRASANNPAAQAAISFDYLRAMLAGLPDPQRRQAWEHVADTLAQLAEDITRDHAA